MRNSDPVPVVYRLRTKDRSFPRFSKCHGYLEPNNSDEITVVIPSAESWPRDPAEFAGRRHRVVVENLTVPPGLVKPNNARDASSFSGTNPPLVAGIPENFGVSNRLASQKCLQF